jgi:hypothetical protein
MSTSVRVIMEVEVTVGVWGDDTNFAELKVQAVREASQIIGNLDKVRLIGALRCKFVTFEKDVQ